MQRSRKYALVPLSADLALEHYREDFSYRAERLAALRQLVLEAADATTLSAAALQHHEFGLHRTREGVWRLREWAPHATALYIVGDATDWQELPAYSLSRQEGGCWEIELPAEALQHGQHYKLHVHWEGGSGTRLPSYCRRVVQDHTTKIFCAQVWAPEAYTWQSPPYTVPPRAPLIYESHVGMAQESAGVGTYVEFRDQILPRIKEAGYNTVQLMAVAEHPYYGSFGYHVANYFAPSSRFGTPEELKSLVDRAHQLGLTVIMDLVHSHSVSNELEGLGRFDGTPYQYFHDGARGHHHLWDSRCFDYSKPEVLQFLLSNCRYWLEEFRIDGFRFDGVTSMLYLHHGLGVDFVHYDQYFNPSVDVDAYAYLALANQLIHELRPDAITVAEDMSGMPGLGAAVSEGGTGFNYRLAMGVPDIWFEYVRRARDEDWQIGHLWHELTNRRQDEQSIAYVESHDQAIVGAKTFAFELMDAAMYDAMHIEADNVVVDRGVALHKAARALTMFSCGDGYLNFMGNEFGHPEWIDFPREGNGWSYEHARRQWSLADRDDLRYKGLGAWDRACLQLLSSMAVIECEHPQQVWVHDEDAVLAAKRGELIIICNLHPSQSYTDYTIPIEAGEYILLLDSDEPQFGGHGRLQQGQHFFTQETEEDAVISLYLPTRTIVFLTRQSPEDCT